MGGLRRRAATGAGRRAAVSRRAGAGSLPSLIRSGSSGRSRRTAPGAQRRRSRLHPPAARCRRHCRWSAAGWAVARHRPGLAAMQDRLSSTCPARSRTWTQASALARSTMQRLPVAGDAPAVTPARLRRQAGVAAAAELGDTRTGGGSRSLSAAPAASAAAGGQVRPGGADEPVRRYRRQRLFGQRRQACGHRRDRSPPAAGPRRTSGTSRHRRRPPARRQAAPPPRPARRGPAPAREHQFGLAADLGGLGLEAAGNLLRDRGRARRHRCAGSRAHRHCREGRPMRPCFQRFEIGRRMRSAAAMSGSDQPSRSRAVAQDRRRPRGASGVRVVSINRGQTSCSGLFRQPRSANRRMQRDRLAPKRMMVLLDRQRLMSASDSTVLASRTSLSRGWSRN